MRTSLFFICLLGVFLCSCGDDIHKGYRAPGYDQVLEKQRILNNTKAVKSINSYDELGCEIYDIPKACQRIADSRGVHLKVRPWEHSA